MNPSSCFRNKRGWILSYSALAVLLGWVVFNWSAILRQIALSYVPLPVGDYWRVVQDYSQVKQLHLQVLWRQHNEHRILFPEIVFLLDAFLFGCRGILPLVVSFLCYVALWIVIAWVLLSDKALSRENRITAALLAGLVMSWKGSASALAWPFLLQWTLTQFAVLLSFVFLVLAKQQTRANLSLVLAVLCAAVATYSSADALLLWPVLILAALLADLSKRQMMALVLSAAFVIGWYFKGYFFSQSFHASDLFSHFLYAAGFVSAYLAMPFGNIKSPIFAVYVGVVQLLLTTWLLLYAWRTHLLKKTPAVILFSYSGFVFLTAIATAAGRMNPADPTFTAAKAARYVTVPLVNWAVLVALCLWISSRRSGRVWPLPVLAICFALLIGIGFLKLRWWLRVTDQDFADVQEAALSIQDGLTIPPLMQKIFEDPKLLAVELSELEKHHLSIYDKGPSRWLGHSVAELGRPVASPVSGAITKAVAVPSGMQIFGWADDGDQPPRYRWVVLTNEAGRIIGFAERFPIGIPRDFSDLPSPHWQSWTGFVKLPARGARIRAYIVASDGKRLLPISGSPLELVSGPAAP